MTQREDILRSMEPLFERAYREKKWFICHYQALEFSPSELRKAQAEGRFIFGGVSNWELIDPPKLQDIDSLVRKANKENQELQRRLDEAFE